MKIKEENPLARELKSTLAALPEHLKEALKASARKSGARRLAAAVAGRA